MTTRRRRDSDGGVGSVADYRYAATRKNNPPAALASQGSVQESRKQIYYYDPHLPPKLRFDGTGQADRMHDLLSAARHRTLTDNEAAFLERAIPNSEPWLEWTGQARGAVVVRGRSGGVAHPRSGFRGRLPSVSRRDKTSSVVCGQTPNWTITKQFSSTSTMWAGRTDLILGDSLSVMNSLAARENLAGKVQMIYVDPPYGIGFASNFQPLVRNRNVSDRDTDLTRDAGGRQGVSRHLDTRRSHLLGVFTRQADGRSEFAHRFRLDFRADW